MKILNPSFSFFPFINIRKKRWNLGIPPTYTHPWIKPRNLSPCNFTTLAPFLYCYLTTLPPFPTCHLTTLPPLRPCHLTIFAPSPLTTLPPFLPSQVTNLPPFLPSQLITPIPSPFPRSQLTALPTTNRSLQKSKVLPLGRWGKLVFTHGSWLVRCSPRTPGFRQSNQHPPLALWDWTEVIHTTHPAFLPHSSPPILELNQAHNRWDFSRP